MRSLPYYEQSEVVEQYANRAQSGLEPAESTIVSEYFPDEECRILDLGCGTGRTTAPLAEREYSVVGVDLMPSLIEKARETHPQLSFQVGDATELEFPDETFGAVLFAGRGIDDIPTKAGRLRALLEVWRVLRPGGVLAFDVKNIVNRMLFDPRSLDGWRSQYRFVRRNLRAGSLTSRHALIEFQEGVDRSHAILPASQRRQLRDIGFEVLDVVKSSATRRPVTLDPRPYFVARKPHDP